MEGNFFGVSLLVMEVTSFEEDREEIRELRGILEGTEGFLVEEL